MGSGCAVSSARAGSSKEARGRGETDKDALKPDEIGRFHESTGVFSIEAIVTGDRPNVV